jgi:hypothetical protein
MCFLPLRTGAPFFPLKDELRRIWKFIVCQIRRFLFSLRHPNRMSRQRDQRFNFLSGRTGLVSIFDSHRLRINEPIKAVEVGGGDGEVDEVGGGRTGDGGPVV